MDVEGIEDEDEDVDWESDERHGREVITCIVCAEQQTSLCTIKRES